ncbi:hypothetical protein [Tateyamaria sp.]|uniref:hypothetical protein n=1 Tax=Tateyamaria sp. TaxID=1929288 RepID=UPI00329E33A7
MPYTLKVVGPLRLYDGTGLDVTPSSTKVRGLLALLAMSKNNIATRAWLQSKLWSEQSQEQASHSLRQVLWKLKAAFGEDSSAIKSNRSEIQFDLDKIEISFDNGVVANEEDEQNVLFFGLDAGDPEYDDWLRQQRANQLSNQAASPERKNFLVFVRTDVSPDPIATVLSQQVLNELIGSLNDLGGVSVLGDAGEGGKISSQEKLKSINLNLFIAKLGNRAFMSCELSETSTGAKICLETKNFNFFEDDKLADWQALEFSRRVYEQILAHLAQSSENTINLSRVCAELTALALRNTFRLETRDLRKADELLKLAFEAQPHGQHLAWRAFLRDLGFFQHRGNQHLKSETTQEQLFSEALYLSPNSTTVQIFTAHYRYLQESRVPEALQIAEECIDKERSNPLAWAVLSNILAVDQQPEQSYHAAMRSVRLSQRGNYAYYFQHFACMAAVSNADYEQAVAHANHSLALKPNFASPLRYKVVLDKVLGNEIDHRQSVKNMRRLEADFTVNKLLDLTYPVNTMRRLPLIEAIA